MPWDVLELERCDLAPECFTIYCISISDHEMRYIVYPTRRQDLSGPRCLITYLDTEDSDTSIPSRNKSPWIRGAPHNGLTRHIRLINARISGSPDLRISGSPDRLSDDLGDGFSIASSSEDPNGASGRRFPVERY